MQFSSNQPIYLQIADHICEKILRKEWKDNDRIPAVREIAVDVQVNPNTVVRTYAHLEENGIIVKQRGIGYFIAQDAYQKSLELIKKDFFKNDVPAFLKKMELLEIEFDEIKSQDNRGQAPFGASPQQSTSLDFSKPKKQAVSVENKRVSLPPVEKTTFVEDKMETITDSSPDQSSDKSMSWD